MSLFPEMLQYRFDITVFHPTAEENLVKKEVEERNSDDGQAEEEEEERVSNGEDK